MVLRAAFKVSITKVDCYFDNYRIANSPGPYIAYCMGADNARGLP